MKSEMKGGLSYICLTAMFFVGNTVIHLPFSRGIGAGLPGFAAAVAVAVPYFLLCGRLLARCGGLSLCAALRKNHPAAGAAVAVLFALYALFCALACLRSYITFSDRIILPEMTALFPSLIFLGLMLWFCSLRRDVLLKTALIGAATVTVAVVLLLLAGLSALQAENLLPVDTAPEKLLYQGGSYLAMSLLQGLILLGFFAGQQQRGRRVFLWGLVLGGGVLLLCLVQCIALFGYRFAATLRFPYAYSMSILSFGDKFSRMEGVSYLLYFACCLMKTGVCVYVARDLICGVWPRSRRYFLPAVAAVFLVFCLFPSVFRDLSFGTVALWFILPAVLLPAALLWLLPRRS